MEKADPALEGEGLGLEFLLVQRKDLGRDDRTRATANPAGGGGARHTEVAEQARVTFLADKVAKSVVVGTTAGGKRNAAWSIAPVHEANQGKAKVFNNFEAVAVAAPRLQNTLVRSWACLRS